MARKDDQYQKRNKTLMSKIDFKVEHGVQLNKAFKCKVIMIFVLENDRFEQKV